jgi:hypothetical protein
MPKFRSKDPQFRKRKIYNKTVTESLKCTLVEKALIKILSYLLV